MQRGFFVRLAGRCASLVAAAVVLAAVAQAKPPRQNSTASNAAPHETAAVNSAPNSSIAPSSPAESAEETSSTTQRTNPEETQPSLEAITAAIHRALEGDRSLSSQGRKVGVFVENGRIALIGTVNTPEEKQAVETKAAQIASPETVNDQLMVQPLKGRRPYTTGRIW